MFLLAAFGGLALLAACDDGGGSKKKTDAGDDDDGKPASCAPIGKSVACTGRGGCPGSQVCEESGRYGVCECGDGPITTPGAGDGGQPDAAQPDAGGGMMTAACGAACTTDMDCGGGFCVKERPVTATLQGFGEIKFERFPGGF